MNGHLNYLLVEGPQDVYFLGRILQTLGLRSVESAEHIPAKWTPFLDEVALQRDRAERKAGRAGMPFWQVFKPACLVSASHSVVIEPVNGNRTKFCRTLRATNALIDGGLASLNGLGIVPDADRDPAASLASAQSALRNVGLIAPDNNQEVVVGAPNTGIFVLPGAADAGGLEQMLLDCAEAVYPALVAGAMTFINGVDVESTDYAISDMQEMRTPQGPVKALVGSVSSVLRPGSTIQVSILRDRWVSAPSLALPRVSALVEFLKTLCLLP